MSSREWKKWRERMEEKESGFCVRKLLSLQKDSFEIYAGPLN
jgi:hypothetical protein